MDRLLFEQNKQKIWCEKGQCRVSKVFPSLMSSTLRSWTFEFVITFTSFYSSTLTLDGYFPSLPYCHSYSCRSTSRSTYGFLSYFLLWGESFGHCQFAFLLLLERVNTKTVCVALTLRLVTPIVNIFAFLICRLLRQNIELQALTSIQSNVLLRLRTKSTGGYVPDSRL